MMNLINNIQEKWLKLKEWWSHLTLREKQATATGASALSIFIVYAGLWSPLVNHVSAMRVRLQTEQKTLLSMQAADSMIKKIVIQTKNKNTSLTPVELLDALQKQINQAGLASFITQLKQASNDTVEMHFQAVSFDQLIIFLSEIRKKQAISIVQMSAITEGTPGVVNVDVVMKIK